jgi:signal transduction histidine kinase
VDALERLAIRVGSGVNVVLAAALAVLAALDARQSTQATGRWPFTLGVDLVICVIVLLRRRNRAYAAAAGLATFGAAVLIASLWDLPALSFTGAALAGLLVLGASAVRGLPARQGALTGLAGLCVVGGAGVSHAASTADAEAAFGLAGAVIWAAALGVGGWLRYLDWRRGCAIDAVRRDERLELARELHDVVAHYVTGIVVQAQAAGFVGEAHPRELVSALSSIESAGLDALTSMRRLVGLLRAPGEAAVPAAAPEPLTELVARFRRHGPAVDLRAPADLPDPAWPPEVITTLYRVVQEALTNVIRHAPDARAVTITISCELGQVTAEIVNDSAFVPPNPHCGGGYGLVGMRERVEALGGKFCAGPLQPTRWSVRASLPLAAGGGA